MIKEFIDKGELIIVKNFITLEEENKILENYPENPSNGKDKRNLIERYGSSMPYKGHMKSLDIPKYFQSISEKIVNQKLLEEIPDSVTINEYLPGQAIKYHIDSDKSGKIITVVSLTGHATMGFKTKDNKSEFHIEFPPRALVQISGDLRYKWKHCILPVESKRYSIVFRNSKLL